MKSRVHTIGSTVQEHSKARYSQLQYIAAALNLPGHLKTSCSNTKFLAQPS